MIVGSYFRKTLGWGLVVIAFFRIGLYGAGTVDSLKTLLPDATGERKVDLLNQLSEIIGSDDLSLASQYADDALVLAKKLGYNRGTGDAFYNQGVNNYYQGMFDEAKELFIASLEVYNREGIKDRKVSSALNNIGAVFDEWGQKDSAMVYYFKAREFSEKIGSKEGMAEALNNIAFLQTSMENHEDAIKTMEKVLEIDKAVGSQAEIANTYSMLGSIYLGLKEYDKSIQYHLDALQIRKELGKKADIARTYNNLARSYEQLGDSGQAEEYYNLSLGQKRELNNPPELAITLYNMGKLLVGSRKPEKALSYLEEAYAISQNYKTAAVMDLSLQELAKAYYLLGNYPKAYLTQVRFAEVNDSLNQQNKEKFQEELITRYETEKKERENEALKAKQARLASRQYLLVAVLAVVLLIALLIFNRYRAKIRTNNTLRELNTKLEASNQEIAEKNSQIQNQADLLSKRNEEIRKINQDLERIVEERTASLRETNQELDTFLYQSTHALRRPLLRMLGLYNILKEENDPETIRIYADNMSKTIKTMDQMLYKLVEINEVNSREPILETVQVKSLVDEILPELEITDPESTELLIDIHPELKIRSDAYMLRSLIKNLLENSLKYRNPEKAQIQLSVEVLNGHTQLRIWDNGIGIPSNALPQVWQMFFRATEKANGEGLGLFLVAKIVSRLRGTTQIESEEGKFTQIIISLPTY